MEKRRGAGVSKIKYKKACDSGESCFFGGRLFAGTPGGGLKEPAAPEATPRRAVSPLHPRDGAQASPPEGVSVPPAAGRIAPTAEYPQVVISGIVSPDFPIAAPPRE